MNMSDEFFSVVTAIFLLRGFGITLLIAVFTIFFSFLIGSILGVAKESPQKFLLYILIFPETFR